jgi:hypothetical protein
VEKQLNTPIIKGPAPLTHIKNTPADPIVNHPVIPYQKTKPVIKYYTSQSSLKISFLHPVKSTRRLMKTKEIHQLQMDKWLIYMIVLYCAGVLFLVLSLIFLHILISPVLYYIFLVVSLVCLAAATIILPMGLAGLI